MDRRDAGVLAAWTLLVCLAPASGSAQTPDTTSGARPPQESCVTCHDSFGEGSLFQPVEEFRGSVHAARGFGCTSCHGGDGEEMSLDAMDPEQGYIGVPAPQDIPGVCGRCHSDAEFMRRYNPSIRVDQVAEYRTSVHGERLFTLGDEKVATCIDCHTAHAIKPPSDPNSSVHPLNVVSTCGGCHADSSYMAEYGIPTDQVEKYRGSVHWATMSEAGDLSAPTCNDCHGNHGAAPPGVEWVGNVCGQCHTVMAELFSRSFHSEIFTMLGSPGCATCHNNHEVERATDSLLGVQEGAVCARCHSADGGGGMAAARMRSLIDSLRTRLAMADSILNKAENAGMEVSQAQFDLRDGRSSLVHARTAIHSFSVDSVRARVEAGLEVALQARQRGVEALEELSFRRLGLAISVTIILVLIVGLVLKIREIETGPGHGTVRGTQEGPDG